MYLCSNMRKHIIIYFILYISILTTMLGCHRDNSQRLDLAQRAKVDRFNKEAFLNRYHDPDCAIHEAYDALALLHDSLPTYYDGLMRAYNNLAFNYYMLALHDSSAVYVDSVLMLANMPAVKRTAKNEEVETVIAKLMRIRLLQRSCQIAESYQLLYDIDRSKVLKYNKDNYLYSYALMEYYITSLTLNYHYRNEALATSSNTLLTKSTQRNLENLINEIQEAQPDLKCDYSEDLSLNYALAHSYYRLASAQNGNPRHLMRTYDFLEKNLKILSLPNHYSVYHLANVFQLQAFVVADTNISKRNIEAVLSNKTIAELDSMTVNLYPLDSINLLGNYGLDMFRISTDLFFQTNDPYQHLGAVVAAAEYCRSIGEYDLAHDYYSRILDDTTWHDNMAPKFEAMLYDGLIRSGYSTSFEQNILWYERESDLQTYIRENESADAMLQDWLDEAETRNRLYRNTIFTTLPFLVLMMVLVILLINRSKRLRIEKQALQEAKRQDVERIANVETCLSVMRHDVNPFLSYLQNKKLSPEMRQEVLEQLLRTFSNIKNWTNLSIPSGLIFRPTKFLLKDVFDNVAATCINIHEHVKLTFDSTEISIHGDQQLTEILIRNLVNNALQHTDEGSVTISASPEDGKYAHITIADTGEGMDEETIENLFRADKKIDSANDSSHGFGLILCKYIIKRHDDNTLRGCRIWAESQLGQGTTMHVILALATQKQ